MKKYIIFFLFAFSTWAAVDCTKSRSFSSSWLPCTSDSQCVRISGACGYTSVNRKHLDKARAYYTCASQHVDCVNHIDYASRVTCSKNRCKLVKLRRKK